MESQPEKTITIDGIPYCWCKGHANYEPCDDFAMVNGSNKRQANCKVFNRHRITRKKYQTQEKITDQEASDKILKSLGYNLQEDIHQQFLERHNL